jgi:glycosyltransferase involved in cell wall biosynthesis
MKLACVGPIGPLKTGISYFNERFVPFLQEHCTVELFTDRKVLTASPEAGACKIPDIDELLSKPTAFDAILYHMGNNYRYHARIYRAMLQAPGFVLLHDCVLSHFFAKYYLESGNVRGFRRAFTACYPSSGSREIEQFLQMRGDFYRFAMAGIAARASRAAVAMNNYGKGIVEREAPDTPVLKINFPYFPFLEEHADSVELFKKKRRIAPDVFVVTSIGHITPAKRLDVALQGFQKFHKRFPKSVFLIAGQSSARSSVEHLIREWAPESARFLGYLERADVDALMQMSDVCVNLRFPSQGEMSSTLIDMMGRGKVVAVSNYAQFEEFPDEACIKINVGQQETDELASALLQVAADKQRAQVIGNAARKHILEHHDSTVAAGALVEFIEQNLSAKPSLSTAVSLELLEPDAFPLKYRQALAYNLRRMLSYAKEQGLSRLFGEGFRRLVARRE